MKFQIIKLANEIGLEKALNYRPNAIKIKDFMLGSIKEVKKELKFVHLDFQDIETSDFSSIDEIVIIMNEELKILKEFFGSGFVLLISNVGEELEHSIISTILLKQRKLNIKIPIICINDSGFSVLGDIEDNLKETLNLFKERRTITARELSDLQGISINGASNKLKRLFDYNLLNRREEIDKVGKQHVYELPLS